MSTRWTWRDHLGSVMVRWGFGRGSYRVEPGLYAVGQPTTVAPLLVTANYKLTFDTLRRELGGTDAWILVLDTDGVNAWCAAGKGRFGTEELVRRITETKALQLVDTRRVILPQLAGPGVAAYEVARRIGCQVVYGPVRASDLPAFLRAGMRVSPAMRRVTFDLRERLALAPVELVRRFIPALGIMMGVFLLAGLRPDGYRLATEHWGRLAIVVWSNFLCGLVGFPALLPYLPGRSFALKGGCLGLALGLILGVALPAPALNRLAVCVISVAACSFLGLMFTGSTPYTSMSGVKREMKVAVPLQAVAAVTAAVLWISALWGQGS